MSKLLMVSALLFGSASALHATAPSLASLHEYTFDNFVKAYGKTYANEDERASREATFNANLKMIRAHNANPSKSYTMNVNHMADFTKTEFMTLKGYVPASRRGLVPYLRSAQSVADVRVGDLPGSVDWRQKGVVTPTKNQGGCGSCWAFASAETMESHWAIKTGQLVELSTQQVTRCTPNPRQCGGSGGCQGATSELGYEFAINSTGIVAASAWPYTGTDGPCNPPAGAHGVANFSSYVRIPTNDQLAMMEAVATKGPLTIGVWADPMQFYFGGVFSGCSYTQNVNIDHAVQLVGYGTDTSLGKDYWIVRNSWGASWGEGGYIRLIREAEPKCGMDTTPHDGSACKDDPNTPIRVCGQCGILAEASYPIAK